MSSERPSKTVQIGANSFAITGERTCEGRLRFSVVDIDCALSEPDDELALQFQDALKRRLLAVRQKRAARALLRS